MILGRLLRRLKRGVGADRGPVSLVMMLRDRPAISDEAVVAAVRRAVPLSTVHVERLPEITPPAWAPHGSPPGRLFLVRAGKAAYGVAIIPYTYMQDPDADARRISRADFVDALRQHVAWIGVDYVGGEVDDPYTTIGAIAAELMPGSCHALYMPASNRMSFPTPVLREALRRRGWREQFDAAASPRIVGARADDPRLAEAAEQARRRWPEFQQAFFGRQGAHFAVKTAFTDGDNVEHMWISVETVEGAAVRGRLGNAPTMVTNVREGDVVIVNREQIEDWLFVRRGKMVGGFSVRVLTEQAGAG